MKNPEKLISRQLFLLFILFLPDATNNSYSLGNICINDIMKDMYVVDLATLGEMRSSTSKENVEPIRSVITKIIHYPLLISYGTTSNSTQYQNAWSLSCCIEIS